MIELQHVSKTYTGRAAPVTALFDLSLSVETGEFVAIVGASGSGKSTLLQILGCLDAPTTGRYVLDGTPVQGLDDAELSHLRNRRVGFVFQSFNLLPRATALENVELPLLYANGTAPNLSAAPLLLKRVGVAHRARHYPAELSGGEQQRVAIARALVMSPSLLLADEPTGNLDAATGAQVLQLIHDLNDDGLTVVLVTHDPAIAAQADRRITIADGRIV
jgi:putative ABC transport system ATP-binding protein